MIIRLAELNRVLLAATAIAPPSESVTQASVVQQCETIVIDSVLPDHYLSIQFAESLEFLSSKDDRITVSESGKEFLDLNPGKSYELTSDQKRMLIRKHYLSGRYRNATIEILECFTKVYDAQTFRWSDVDSLPMKGDLLIVEHLIQLEVLTRLPSILEVKSEYVDAVANLLAEGKGWTPEALEEYLAERKEIGEIAEELMLAHEKERVRTAGGKVECSCISHISKLRPDAGYDIASFDGESRGMAHDRFIEVKGAKSTKIRFYMSDNEIKVAKTLKEKYWVYFIGGINKKTRTATNTPLLFQNPVDTVLSNPKYKITPQGVLIEEL